VSNRSGVLLLTAVLLYGACRAYAADPQPYKVDMASTGDSTLNSTLKATSDLETLRKSAPVGPFGLIGRARGDLERLKTVLESFGYYQSYVEIRIDGLPLDDPGLGEELTSKSKDADAEIKITFSIGPLYHLRKIEIDGQVPREAEKALGLETGAPAIAADVLAAGDRLLNALEDQGYAFAKVDTPIAHEDPPNRVLDVSFHAVPGDRVQIGRIQIRGLKDMKEEFIRKRLLVHTGDQFGASKIEAARKDLLALGVFSSVSVRVADKADSEGRVPVAFNTRERLQHSVRLSAAYSSDLGGSTGVTWTKRNVSGKADSLTLSADAINLGGGTPKNFINQASVQAEFFDDRVGGHRYALQIVTDVPHFGGASGSSLEEAQSWGKLATDSARVSVQADATIALPLLASALAATAPPLLARRRMPVFTLADRVMTVDGQTVPNERFEVVNEPAV